MEKLLRKGQIRTFLLTRLQQKNTFKKKTGIIHILPCLRCFFLCLLKRTHILPRQGPSEHYLHVRRTFRALAEFLSFQRPVSGPLAATLKDGSDAPACYLDYSQVLVGWLVGVGRLGLVVMKMSNMTCLLFHSLYS